MKGLLEGLKVIQMGHVAAIPTAGSMLAEWGAEVIKLEPLDGEVGRLPGRSYGVPREVDLNGHVVNYIFELHNRGQKGIAINLKKPAGKEAILKLIEKTDIFMTNYEVGALKNLGMDYAGLSRVNPRLIYGFLTGYGTKGPDKDERGFDLTAAWARSGGQYMTADPSAPPPPQRFAIMDKTSAAYLVSGLLAAVIHRDRTGQGQEIDISLYHTAVWSLSTDIQAALVGRPFPRHDHAQAENPLANNYRSKDGKWFLLFNPRVEISWEELCEGLGRPDLINDQRFDTEEKRAEHNEEIIRIMDQAFATKNLNEWEPWFREKSIIYGRVQTPTEVTTDPQALVNNFFTELDYGNGAKMKVVNTPVNFHQNPAFIKGPAPELGQHTEEVLLDLGYDWDDLSKLKEDGVIL
ncbi:MAG: CoA transferase [Deltaproteobacteria bacterium]|nr:CoA transferase [Deltaproteobacteria bacterium]